MDNEQNQEILLSTIEAGELLGVGPERVRQFIADDRLPARRVSRQYVIKMSDVLKFKQITRETGRPKKRK